ncbi:hypothetical protein ABPG73_007064 [Tetrahymena malaccensis]
MNKLNSDIQGFFKDTFSSMSKGLNNLSNELKNKNKNNNNNNNNNNEQENNELYNELISLGYDEQSAQSKSVQHILSVLKDHRGEGDNKNLYKNKKVIQDQKNQNKKNEQIKQDQEKQIAECICCVCSFFGVCCCLKCCFC